MNMGVNFVNIKLRNVQNDMKSDKKHVKSINDRQSFLLKMVTSYSIFLFIILILFLYLYNSAARHARSQYEWQMESAFMSNAQLFEKDLDIIEVYCRQLIQNDSFRKNVNINETDSRFSELGYSISAMLSTDMYPESLLPISEVYCYLPNSGYILAPNYFLTQDRYYSWIKRYPDDVYESWLKALTSPSNYYRFLPMDDLTPTSSKSYYMYLINMNDLYYININAVVCFIFEKDKLSSLFECMDSDMEYHYLSVRTDGQSDSILSLTTPESAQLDIMISEGGIDDANAFLQSAGASVGTYYSADTGFTYYFSYPSYESASNFARPQILYPAIFAAAVLGGLGLIYMFSKQNMKPILELDQQLQATEQERSSLLEEKSHLQEVMDSQRPMICNSYVRLLLKGMIVSEQEASYAKDFLGLTDENLIFNSLYVVAYNNVDATLSPASIPRTSQECNDIVLETLRQYMGENIYYFSPSDRSYALILAGRPDDEKDLIMKANKIIVNMHDYLLDSYGIWLFAGIGKNTDDIVNVWESYQQAVEAVSYTSKNYIFFPYEFIKKDSSTFYYPMELSTKLIHFITTGNTPQVLELFNLLHQENIEERSLPINMLQFLLSDIRNTLLKARFALPQNTPRDVIQTLDECFNEHASFKLCEDIALRLCRLFTVESDGSSIISTIEKYIRENYADPSMGLNKISDEFQISESYFSHMFKEKTGVNFSTYLENIRMNEALRLIRETDISLNELYLSVGYNNSNTFRRAFKKVYGITPSTVRDAKQ